MSPSEKVFQGPKVVVNRFGRYLAQKLSVIRYFKCHPGSLFRVFVLEFGGGGKGGVPICGLWSTKNSSYRWHFEIPIKLD